MKVTIKYLASHEATVTENGSTCEIRPYVVEGPKEELKVGFALDFVVKYPDSYYYKGEPNQMIGGIKILGEIENYLAINNFERKKAYPTLPYFELEVEKIGEGKYRAILD